jgi:membrane protein
VSERRAHRLADGARVAARLAGRTVAEFFDDGCPQRAAAISYYGLFSLFPLAILLVGIFGLVVREEQARTQVIEFLLDNLPLRQGEGRRDLQQLLDDVTAGVGGFGVLSLLGLVFSASGLMGAIRQAFNAAWDVEDARPPVQGKLIDIGLVFGVGALIAVSLAISVVAGFAASLSGSLAGLGLLGTVVRGLLSAGALSSTILAFVAFVVLFRVVPACPTRLADVWPGALIAAAGLEAAKLSFGVYLGQAADYNAVYASLGSIVAFMVFVFVAANVVLLGAEAAAHWPDVRDHRGPPDGDGPPLRERATAAVRGLFVRDVRARSKVGKDKLERAVARAKR